MGGWSWIAFSLAFSGAAGGMLVALSIKHGDSILKTLATTGAIIISAILDHWLLGGPLTPSMMIAGVQVVLAICNYTFDATLAPVIPPAEKASAEGEKILQPLLTSNDEESGMEKNSISKGED